MTTEIVKKNKGGRPLKFQSVEELQKKIDKYFETTGYTTITIIKDGKEVKKSKYIPSTVTGLAVALDVDRDTLIRYGKKEEFYGTIKTAKIKCENALYQGGLTGDLNTAVVIFGLKNNYGWEDKVEQNINVRELPKPIKPLVVTEGEIED